MNKDYYYNKVSAIALHFTLKTKTLKCNSVCLSNFAACQLNTYKSGERTCSACPLHSHTDEPAQMQSGCICDNGYSGLNDGTCRDVDECASNFPKGGHDIS